MDTTFFTRNRRNLRQLLDDELFVATAHHTLQKSDDTSYPFRQESNFWYLTGIDVPDCIFVMREDEEMVFIPDPSKFNTTWHGDDLTAEQARQLSGISNVYYLSQKAAMLKKIVQTTSTVTIVEPDSVTKYGITPNPAFGKLKSMLRRYGATTFKDVSNLLQRLRMVKHPDEIAILQEVTLETEATLEKLRPLARPGIYEYELAAFITAGFMRKNYRSGYEPIVATGMNAFALHYRANTAQLQDGQAVLVDAGAQKHYYSADVTRMLEVGDMTPDYYNVYHQVQAWQQDIINSLKPGALLRDIGKQFRAHMLEYLKSNSLVSASAKLQDTLEFCPHGYGHHLGVDLHDAADYEAPLAPGMVFMVEPGLYTKEKGVAVRIEDAYVITEDGCVKLTKMVK